MARLGCAAAAGCALLAGCASSSHEAELRRLTAAVDELRVEAAHDRDRIEDLSNRVLVLSDRVDALRSTARRDSDGSAPAKTGAASPTGPAAETWGAPPRLEVVRLEPHSAASPQPEPATEPPVQLTLSGAQQPDSLPVVDVPPPPRHHAGGKMDEADRLFRAALAAYRKGDGELAYERFESFLQRFPRHPNADNALFWMAESRFEAGRFGDAAARYRELVDRYPTSGKTADALLKMGLAYEHLGDSAEAKQAFERVVASHPESAVADLARSRLGGSQ